MIVVRLWLLLAAIALLLIVLVGTVENLAYMIRHWNDGAWAGVMRRQATFVACFFGAWALVLAEKVTA